MIKQSKVMIKTRIGFNRFEFFLAENEKEVKCIVEETIKQGEKVRHLKEDGHLRSQM